MAIRPKGMTLNFPNLSRSFDPKRNRVRFWGYDRAIEISFFMEEAALLKLNPEMNDAEGDILRVFDAALERIHEVANIVYGRGNKDSYAYSLAAKDF